MPITTNFRSFSDMVATACLVQEHRDGVFPF